MRMPLGTPLHLMKYSKLEKEEELIEQLSKHSADLVSFFLVACNDELWIEFYPNSMKAFFKWLTDAHIHTNLPYHFFHQVIPPTYQNMEFLKAFIPLDLTIKSGEQEYFFNSLLLSHHSYYFRRRIMKECPHVERRILKIDGILPQTMEVIEKFVLKNIAEDVWKKPHEELWALLKDLEILGFASLREAWERVLHRYINRNNVVEILIKAHHQSLPLLKNGCIEFINQLDWGMRFLVTSINHLSIEFLNYNATALEVFSVLSPYITHLTFSGAMAANPYFKMITNRTPHLIGLDLSESTIFSDYLVDLPPTLQELCLSHCPWVNAESLNTLANTCPHLFKLDLSSNEHLNYGIWPHLQHFKQLKILDISRCLQINDNDLKMIIQACPYLVELSLVNCQKINSEAFFHLGRLLSNLSALNFSRTLLTDAALIDIMMHCKNLYFLDISRCDSLSEKGVLEGIKSCPSIKKIFLKHSFLSKNGIEQIRNIFPYLELETE
ncbi:hypothetical protein DB42_CT00040 [Neochlamydia sp. EPS4]|nr:hypothetical protein DB42_CT00040 [Neochlamydia sp. EPS4]